MNLIKFATENDAISTNLSGFLSAKIVNIIVIMISPIRAY